jgi:SAM-dependent methyltransferase
MLPRVLEPEVMDTLAEAVDYDSMDHSAVNQSFSEEFLAAMRGIAEFGPRLNPATPFAQDTSNPQSTPLSVLDVGTGTARIPIALCRLTDRLRITAIDLSAQMLQLGQRNVISHGFERQIRLEQVDAKKLPYPDDTFDALISNSIVHHIPQPIDVVREMLRVLRPGGLFFIRDLVRPPDAEEIATILAKHAGGSNEHQRQLFEQSLHASLTLDDVRDLLRELGLPSAAVTRSSDRHWTICTTK